MAQNLIINGVQYASVPEVDIPKSGDGTPDPNDSNTGHGTLSGSKIPAGAAYARLCGTWYDSAHMSLVRTA